MNIGILASHNGTTAAAVIEGCRSGRIAGRVAAVVSNNSGAGVLELARSAGCVTYHLSRATHPEPEELDRAAAAVFLEQDTDVLLLAGYLRKVGPVTLDAFAGRVLNIHPSLLPRHGGEGMYGMAVHEAVIEAGDTETGASVHVVTAQYDEGEVIARAAVSVAPDDDAKSLDLKVRVVERELIVATLARISRGELSVPGYQTLP